MQQRRPHEFLIGTQEACKLDVGWREIQLGRHLINPTGVLSPIGRRGDLCCFQRSGGEEPP